MSVVISIDLNDNVIYISACGTLYKISDSLLIERKIRYLDSIIGESGIFVTEGIIDNNLVSKYDYCGGNTIHPDSYKKKIIYNETDELTALNENTYYIIHNYYYDTESG